MAVTKTLRSGLGIFSIGFGMGVCDLMPGISGSSVAYLCGVYEKLVEAIRRPLAHLPFLIPLALGIVSGLVSLCIPLNFALQSSFLRPLVFSFFIGVSLVCAARAFVESKNALGSLVIGALCGFALNLVGSHEFTAISPLWLFPVGILTGCTMLLPAISGAQVLYLLGLYPIVLGHLANLAATGDLSNLYPLGNLAIGGLIGLWITSCLMRTLLERSSRGIYGLFAGFIAMSLPRLWPFGPIVEKMAHYWIALAMLVLGLVIGTGFYLIGKESKKGDKL